MIFAKNNQGKTNFLESIYFVTNGFSPIETKSTALINYDANKSLVGLDFDKQDESYRLYLKFDKSGKKEFYLNNKLFQTGVKRDTFLITDFISADILHLFQKSPDFRRKKLDDFCRFIFKDYQTTLSEYERVLKQKNTLLKLKKGLTDILFWQKN